MLAACLCSADRHQTGRQEHAGTAHTERAGQSWVRAGLVNVCAAIELSKSRWVVAIQVQTSEKISVHKIAGGDVRSLLQLLDRTRSKLIAAGFDQVEVHCCYEIGYDGCWLHRLLEREGIHNHVLDRPASTSVVAVDT